MLYKLLLLTTGNHLHNNVTMYNGLVMIVDVLWLLGTSPFGLTFTCYLFAKQLLIYFIVLAECESITWCVTREGPLVWLINISTIVISLLVDFMPLCEQLVDRVSIDPVTTPLSVNKLLLIFY